MRACVVVPARDEEELIGACIAALAAQTGVARADYEVLLVLDRCTDATEAARPRRRGRHDAARDRGHRTRASATRAARAWTWPRSACRPTA